MESKENIKFIGIINYKKFRYQPIDEKIKLFFKKNIFELETSPLRQEKPIVSNINLENPLIINRFFPFWFKNKRYRISEILIEDLQQHLYNDFIFEKNYYQFKIQEIRIRIRKERLATEKIKILDEIYRKTISLYNSEEILDYIQNNNLYLKDKTEYLQTDFNNDSLFYDFDYLYYIFIYDNADKVFSYIFNYKWENKKLEFIAQIMKVYEAKKVIEFCIKEIKKIEKSNTQNIEPKKNINKNTQNTSNYFSKIWISEEFEKMFHSYLINENVIDKESQAIEGFKDAAGVILRIKTRIKEKVLKKRVHRADFANFLNEKYNAKISIKPGFKIGNSNYSEESCEDYIVAFLNKDNG